MKTKEEVNSINRLLSCLSNFLTILSEETHCEGSYPVADYNYDNETESVYILYENGEELRINVHMDSVSASMKDVLKRTLFDRY